jgi:hypothetical protein
VINQVFKLYKGTPSPKDCYAAKTSIFRMLSSFERSSEDFCNFALQMCSPAFFIFNNAKIPRIEASILK